MNRQFVARIFALALIVMSFFFLFRSFVSLIRTRTHLENTATRDRERNINAISLAADAAQKKLDDDELAFEREIVAEIKELQKNQSASGGGMSLAERAALAEVVEGQKQISTRLSALEGALLNEPVKALAVPLLKKDVDDVLDREKKDADAVRAQDDRLDRLLTNVMTTILSVLGLFVSVLIFVFAPRKTSTTTPRQGF